MNAYYYTDIETYDYEDLTSEDKKVVDVLLKVKDNVLNENVIDDYLDRKGYGNKMRGIVKELYMSLMEELREQMENRAIDFVVDTLDEYPDDYIKKDKNEKNNEVER